MKMTNKINNDMYKYLDEFKEKKFTCEINQEDLIYLAEFDKGTENMKISN
jgi:hypothetical protein